VTSQHLSDEAVAAFADGVLSGHARERARRHAAGCPECARAVRVQREVVFALRSAPAPALPLGLLDRLRSVPTTTPLDVVPSVLGRDGSAMFAAFGTIAAAATGGPPTSHPSVPSVPADGDRGPAVHERRGTRIRPIMMTAAAVAAAGVLVVGSGAQASVSQPSTDRRAPGGSTGLLQAPQVIVPVSAAWRLGP
jgi:anti-sigma factor RsiW